MVYKHFPLRKHRHAIHAARAACCADEVGLGKKMANELFEGSDLSPTGCERIAEHLGIEVESFRECVAAERTQKRIDSDVADGRQLAVRFVPTYWIGSRPITGGTSVTQLRAHIEAALPGE